ncbi:MAG: Crp/Fnr family transcriptional regulator [Bacillota bacterium]|nr:Crp/Fnr family transcriptional regulator [Bacillota bacterium]
MVVPKPFVGCLRDLDLFEGLDSQAFESVCATALKRLVPKGSYLFRQGDTAAELLLVKSGKIKLVQVTPEGRQIIHGVLGPGDTTGEHMLFSRTEQPCDAIALEETCVCGYSRERLEVLTRQYPSVAVQIIGHLSRKLSEATNKIEDLAGIPVKEKVVRLMCRLAEKHGRPLGSELVLIELDLTQSEIASMVGASRVMVANVLGELRSAGTIERRGRRYAVKRSPATPESPHSSK